MHLFSENREWESNKNIEQFESPSIYERGTKNHDIGFFILPISMVRSVKLFKYMCLYTSVRVDRKSGAKLLAIETIPNIYVVAVYIGVSPFFTVFVRIQQAVVYTYRTHATNVQAYR